MLMLPFSEAVELGPPEASGWALDTCLIPVGQTAWAIQGSGVVLASFAALQTALSQFRGQARRWTISKADMALTPSYTPFPRV
jgi:hypothetical protein